ncbi:hypothetical protein [Mesorhizobium sp.]|uniref:hypothetical protein n=1 Tax=Mesorhizobium sp. TaxID=1871066 RepID=UPI000FEA8AE6|nr:hypothetical protein [Mesorhizobium sp.]RWL01840.1 MAG: hypothetical protein EOR56_33890 [Mesorhizobium sp.]
MNILDKYALKARLFPALLTLVPALALAFFAVSWTSIGPSQAFTAVAIAVLFFFFSDLARRAGKRVEPKVFAAMGGIPSVTLLRHRDRTIDSKTKARYVDFLASKLGESAPTREQEIEEPGDADHFYERCGTWLREHTRDKVRFEVLFNELVTYGFRRNLYGLRWWGLSLNAIVVAICLWLLYRPDASVSLAEAIESGLFPVFVVAAIHAIGFGLWVTRGAVIDAAKQYARQLILSCEGLMVAAVS